MRYTLHKFKLKWLLINSYHYRMCLTGGFALLLFLLQSSSLLAQIDSARIIQLRTQIKESPNDSVRAYRIVELARLYENLNPETAFLQLNRALALAKKERNLANEAYVLYVIGIVHCKHDNYPKAIEYELNAIEINTKIGNELGVADNLLVIGNAYINLEKIDEARNCFDRALLIYKKLDKPQSIAKILISTASADFMEEKYKKAIEGYKSALSINTKLGNDNDAMLCLANLAMTYAGNKDYTNAADYALQALQMAQESKSDLNICLATSTLAEVSISQKKYDKAERYAIILRQSARNMHSKLREREAFRLLTKIYKGKKDYEGALKYMELANEMQDSIGGDGVKERLQRVEGQYAIEKKQTEIRLLKKEQQLQQEHISNEKLQKYLLIACLAAVIAVLIISVISLLNIRKYSLLQKEQRVKLAEKNAELKQQKEEMEQQAEYTKQLNEELKTLNESLREAMANVENQKIKLNQLNNNLVEAKQAGGDGATQVQNLIKFATASTQKLRSPLARVLGLINLFEIAEMPDNQRDLVKYMKKSVHEIDAVVNNMQDNFLNEPPK